MFVKNFSFVPTSLLKNNFNYQKMNRLWKNLFHNYQLPSS